MTSTMPDLAGLTSEYSAHNYTRCPSWSSTADGVWVTDVAGRRYLDMLAGYSALNFGHRHPRLVGAAARQLERVTLVSRAFDHDQFGPFCAELAELCGMDMVLPMNTGAEAVETAIKVARKWGYVSRGVPRDEALIVVFDGNFHGRTTTIVSFSSDPDARADFGPYTPGFVSVPYGDLTALVRRVRRTTGTGSSRCSSSRSRARRAWSCRRRTSCAGVRTLCTSAGALLIADEIQSGLGRVGATFACCARGCRTRRVPARQGARRRDRAGVRDGVLPLGARRAAPGPARLDVRRQPAGLRGRPRGDRDAADRRVPGSGRLCSGLRCTSGWLVCRRRWCRP